MWARNIQILNKWILQKYRISNYSLFCCRQVKQLKTHGTPDCKIFLIGNKIDLQNRVVSSEEAINYKTEHRFEYYMETSAKTRVTIRELFVNCGLTLYNKYLKEGNFDEINDNDDDGNFDLNRRIKEEENECQCQRVKFLIFKLIFLNYIYLIILKIIFFINNYYCRILN